MWSEVTGVCESKIMSHRRILLSFHKRVRSSQLAILIVRTPFHQKTLGVTKPPRVSTFWVIVVIIYQDWISWVIPLKLIGQYFHLPRYNHCYTLNSIVQCILKIIHHPRVSRVYLACIAWQLVWTVQSSGGLIDLYHYK